MGDDGLDDLRLAIREVLVRHWDPHGVEGRPEAWGTYDGYAAGLAELVRTGAGEDEVVEYLFARERESMCFPPLGKGRLLAVARRVIGLKGARVS
jgi:hypothetical protein